MKKEEVLALIDAAKLEAIFALERDDIKLTDEERKRLEDTVIKINNFSERFKDVPEDDTELIESYHRSFTMAVNDLVNFRIKKEQEANVRIAVEDNKEVKPKNECTDLMVIPAKEKKITKVIPEEEQEEHTKKERKDFTNILKNILVSAAAVAVLVAAIKYCSNQSKESKRVLKEEPTTSQSDTVEYPTVTILPTAEEPEDTEELVEVTPEIVNRIANVDINNYEDLMAYAIQIQSELKNANLSIDDIMYAIRMANWDTLEDKSCFTDREGVCRSTYNAGLINTELGSDAIVQKDINSDIFITDMQMTDILMCVTDNKLSLEDFESAKVEDKGYDIYAVIDSCVKGMYAHKDSENEEEIEQDKLYAMVFNDVVARSVVNFSIVNSDEALLCTMYNVLGTYTANKERILDLTKYQGPIYGTGPRIDGNYGNICTLELVTLANIDIEDINGRGNYIGNENCIFYSDFIDEVILNPDQSLGLN